MRAPQERSTRQPPTGTSGQGKGRTGGGAYEKGGREGGREGGQ